MIPPTLAPIADSAWTSRRPVWVTVAAVEMLVVGALEFLFFLVVLISGFPSTHKWSADEILGLCIIGALCLAGLVKGILAIRLLKVSNAARIGSIILFLLETAVALLVAIIGVAGETTVQIGILIVGLVAVLAFVLDILPIIILTRPKIAQAFRK